MSKNEPPPVLHVEGRRWRKGLNGGPPFSRCEAAPGCFVTLFDDGHVRFFMDPPSGYQVKASYDTNVLYPGAGLLELLPEE